MKRREVEARTIRLLFIVNSLVFGGAEKHVVTLANVLDRRRYRLSLAYLKNDDTLLPQLDTANLEGGILSCNVSRKIDSDAVRQLADHIRAERIEVIVCVNTYSLLYGFLARRAARQPAKIVELFHTTELGSIEDQLQMLFYRPFIRASDRLVYVCRNQQRYWRKRLLRARQDCVIHNGVDTTHFSNRQCATETQRMRAGYGFDQADYVIGLCAAMRVEKAHGDLLQAVAQLRSTGLKVKCLLIGDGPQRTRIEQQIAGFGLTSHVHITGFQPDVRPAISCCDVMTIVSHHVETFSIATLEAMAMGKPMVMSHIGGADEQIEDGKNGFLFPKGDVAALTAALSSLRHRPYAEAMGQHARLTVEHKFSLAVMVGAYDRLFTALAAALPTHRERMRVA